MLPAYAGMILQHIWSVRMIGSAPRIRGDDPASRKFLERQLLCSPHTRG